MAEFELYIQVSKLTTNLGKRCRREPERPRLWLELLPLFTALKNLYLSRQFLPGIATAQKELVESRTTEVLPSLQSIFVEGLEPSGHLQENIGKFVVARQLYNHPMNAISA